ncbi:iron(III) transport system substrate-binding protein [Tistlia consotensis]|uniref:Iron(III) transport system substrate-binding protein n=1 Tax=Tistlia consotensis USBA 355 TaxID=560819 RepID=A0A1Y6CUS3_9PROT|nr:Fe(3+) ABC transporter substrate-binding protein [Tistlia consotensis]SMF76306.1 iron(III) transport system substrate-binding protein [Tistlia consotensis USBA 355]SNS12613.1 iron(III) transport system substrate-binding protein [Tistlia consotensis]
MKRLSRPLLAAVTLGLLVLPGTAAQAQDKVLNIYSARHYQTDERLYGDFTEQTGIQINRIEGKDDALIERLRSEGVNSPADILITVDAGRLWRAEQAGLFQPVESEVLKQRLPDSLRQPEGKWFGFSMRARVIFVNPELVPDPPTTYEALADPRYKGLVCMRSSSAIYNLSLLASMIEHDGKDKALAWAEGVVANFARPPQGGDITQIEAVADGECGITIANTYYYVRLLRSDDPAISGAARKVKLVWPNQEGRGVHVNVSGAGVVVNAPHRANAIRFLEYLAGDSAQKYFANGNNEYPVVKGISANPELEALGDPKIDPVNVSVYGENQPLAQMLYDQAGWK